MADDYDVTFALGVLQSTDLGGCDDGVGSEVDVNTAGVVVEGAEVVLELRKLAE